MLAGERPQTWPETRIRAPQPGERTDSEVGSSACDRATVRLRERRRECANDIRPSDSRYAAVAATATAGAAEAEAFIRRSRRHYEAVPGVDHSAQKNASLCFNSLKRRMLG